MERVFDMKNSVATVVLAAFLGLAVIGPVVGPARAETPEAGQAVTSTGAASSAIVTASPAPAGTPISTPATAQGIAPAATPATPPIAAPAATPATGPAAAASKPRSATGPLKPIVRDMFRGLNEVFEAMPKVSLPEGATQIRIKGCKGVKLAAGKFLVQPHVWFGETGLRDEVKRLIASGTPVAVAMNGAFYGKEGPLGQVVIDGVLPERLHQMPAHLSRCFLAWVERQAAGATVRDATVRDATVQGATTQAAGSTGQGATPASAKNGRWVLGETAARPRDLASFTASLACASFSQPLADGETIRHLLGGGGWIIRAGRDVHMEAYQRQKFRFRKVDQDSRHSVVAIDGKGALFMLVFETGLNLSAVSNLLLSRPEFKGVTDAIFFDGGSSSVIVAGQDYLVSPLYFIDKARFTALLAVPAGK